MGGVLFHQTTRAMKTKNNLRNVTLAILFCSMASPLLHAGSGGRVRFSGRILLDGLSSSDLKMSIESDHGEAIPFVLRPSGAFYFTMETGMRATVRITKPGYFTKEIALDSHHALSTRFARRRYKHIRFDVQMQEGPICKRRFAGPVGSVAFAKGTGRVLVRYDRTMMDLNGGTIADLRGR